MNPSRQRRRIVLLAALLAISTIVIPWGAPPGYAATTHEQTFQEANQASLQGRWDVAAAGYRALVAAGVDDPVVWYDLGTAYTHLGDLGRARASYERSLRLRPRDADTRANLETLRARLTDREPPPDPLTRTVERLSNDEVAILGTGGWIGFVGVFLAWRSRRRRGLAWTAGILLLAVSLFGGIGLMRATQPDQAVVIPSEVKIHSGPGREYPPGLSVHAGARVDVLRSEGDWREIAAPSRTSAPFRGWVRAEQIERI